MLNLTRGWQEEVRKGTKCSQYVKKHHILSHQRWNFLANTSNVSFFQWIFAKIPQLCLLWIFSLTCREVPRCFKEVKKQWFFCNLQIKSLSCLSQKMSKHWNAHFEIKMNPYGYRVRFLMLLPISYFFLRNLISQKPQKDWWLPNPWMSNLTTIYQLWSLYWQRGVGLSKTA